ncbi:MAG: CopG family ribbon-helix-helix protein [Betaproteobacteria bacterium]
MAGVIQLSYIFLLPWSLAMPISVRLKPEVERLLDEAARRQRKSRSAVIHDALDAFLRPRRPRLGDAIRSALAEVPGGFGIERAQPAKSDTRAWKR